MNEKYNYINLKYLNDISPDIDFKKKIFSMFKKEIAIIENVMKKSLNEKNYSKLAEIVHKAKSNVSILGMLKESDEMKELETDIKEKKKIESYEQRINKFFLDCYNALEEIKQIEKSF